MSAPLLQVDRVSREFGSGRTLVRAVVDASFETKPGEVTLIMGPSGSGKTTLLSMIGGILRPTAGRIVIDGLEVSSLGRRELPRVRRELVGFVFQTFNLLESLSALENVEIALNIAGVTGPAAGERARALLREAGLEQRLHFNARALSAGERQRVALARALANQPRLLLADEPTANLDSEAGHDVMTLLRGLTERKGHAAVVVSHDPRLREVADQVLRLEDGRLSSAERRGPASAGPPDDGSADTSTRPAPRPPRLAELGRGLRRHLLCAASVALVLATATACGAGAQRHVDVCSNADHALTGSAFVFVEAPTSGERVASGFRVSGCSSTFEATLGWRLRGRDGRVLAHAVAQGGGIEPGRFTFRVRYSVERREIGGLDVSGPSVTSEGFPPPSEVVPLVLGP